MTETEMAIVAGVLLGSLALFLALVGQVACRRRIAELRDYCQRLEVELSGTNSASIGMGQRLIALEKRLQKTQESVVGRDGYDAARDYPYSEANALFEQGLDPVEVANRCGLSQAEATLLRAVQSAGNN